MRRVQALAFITLLAASVAQSDPKPLVPAGSINAVFGHPRLLILAQDDPAAIRQATWIRDRFFKNKSRLVVGEAALKTELKGHNLLVYGTVSGHPWLAKYRDRLPVRYGKGSVQVGEEHRGDHLRVICTIRNPDDPTRRAILYTAEHVEDLRDINGVFHGPTEYVVADGSRVLASGNYADGAALQPKAMREDLEFLIGKVLSVHPATVDGATPALQTAMDQARAAVVEPMSRQRFWLVANHVLLTLRDAHTNLMPPQSGKQLAFRFDWITDGLIATQHLGALERGDRIVSIGGLDEADLLDSLRAVVPAENDHWLRAQGCRRLRDTAFLASLGLDTSAGIQVVVERGGKQQTLTVMPADPSTIPEPPADWVRWSLQPEVDLAVITIDRCVFDDYYRRRVRTFFELVADKQIGRIAIDLRKNTGGNSQVCDEFLRYLAVTEYRTYSAAIRETEDSCAQRGYSRKLGFQRYGPQTQTNQPAEGIEPFTGKLYALTSKHTFSSGSWFAVVLHDNGLAEIIGEPTGGAPSSYGDTLTFTMPNSSLAFTVSFKNWLRPAADDPSRTLAPTRLVRTTRDHILSGDDPVLAWLIAQGG